MILFSVLSTVTGMNCANAQEQKSDGNTNVSKVYMFKEISPENLVKIYEALGREATGKVAVKLSTGEPGGHNFLQPALIKDLVQNVKGTIVECNTAYGGGRADTENHLKAAKDHGFIAIAPVDIMDAEGEVALPVKGGKHLKEDFVGSHYLNYDFTVVLSHFKGHAMGGFGGAFLRAAETEVQQAETPLFAGFGRQRLRQQPLALHERIFEGLQRQHRRGQDRQQFGAVGAGHETRPGYRDELLPGRPPPERGPLRREARQDAYFGGQHDPDVDRQYLERTQQG